ncbi:hypothetical protein CPB86DRAFT_827550 [Serendipita vermifera]|nr:hypothetical protein CPB86DRAFT_827550 [Serendipita vermifera]
MNDYTSTSPKKLGPNHHHAATTPRGPSLSTPKGLNITLDTNTTELLLSVARYDRPRRSASDARPRNSANNPHQHPRSKSKPRSSTLTLMTALHAPLPPVSPSSPTSSATSPSKQSGRLLSGSDSTRSSQSGGSITTLRQTEGVRGRRKEMTHNRSNSAIELGSGGNVVRGERRIPRPVFMPKNRKQHHAYPTRQVPYPRSYDHDVLDYDNWTHLFLTEHLSRITWYEFTTPPARILDVGCGNGLWAIEAAMTWTNAERIVGLDIAPLQTDLTPLVRAGVVLPSVADRVQWIHCNFLEPWPFENASFDFVRMSRIGRGIPAHKWPHILNEAKRVLQSVGGVLEIVEEDLGFPTNGGIKSSFETVPKSDHGALERAYRDMHADRSIHLAPTTLLADLLPTHFTNLKTCPSLVIAYPLEHAPCTCANKSKRSPTITSANIATGSRYGTFLEPTVDRVHGPSHSADPHYHPHHQHHRRGSSTDLHVCACVLDEQTGGTSETSVLHLAQSVTDILACSESMWDYLSTQNINHHASESRGGGGGGGVRVERGEFERWVKNYESDMKQQIGLAEALHDRLEWHVREGLVGEYPDRRTLRPAAATHNLTPSTSSNAGLIVSPTDIQGVSDWEHSPASLNLPELSFTASTVDDSPGPPSAISAMSSVTGLAGGVGVDGDGLGAVEELKLPVDYITHLSAVSLSSLSRRRFQAFVSWT